MATVLNQIELDLPRVSGWLELRLWMRPATLCGYYLYGRSVLGEQKSVELPIESIERSRSVDHARQILCAFIVKAFPPITQIWSDEELGLT